MPAGVRSEASSYGTPGAFLAPEADPTEQDTDTSQRLAFFFHSLKKYNALLNYQWEHTKQQVLSFFFNKLMERRQL